jgi:hypothetical protein
LIDTVSDARSGAPEYFTGSEVKLKMASRPQWLALGLGAACCAAALFFAARHPLSPPMALAGVVLLVAWAAWRPLSVPLLVLGALPLAGCAPWTGWMLVEEYDLLMLAVLGGGWARLAWPSCAAAARPSVGGATGLWWLLVLAYAASVAISMQRGVADAGGLVWGWWQGWREPMNALRLAKPVLWAMLAWPLWQRLQARDPPAAAAAVGAGAVAGLAVVSLLTLWERTAGPGLLNFATDYRTTALFWETHVGGAALDGFVALVLPFGIWALMRADGRLVWSAALAATLLGAYAALTTFSRGLYLAVAISAVVFAAVASARRRGPVSLAGAVRTALAWVVLFALAAWLAFPGTGWRGLLALWGLVVLVFAGWQTLVAPPKPRTAALAALAGLVAGGAAATVTMLFPESLKAPYLLYAAWWGLGVLAAWRQCSAIWIAAVSAVACAAAAVGLHWGEAAVERWWMLPAAALLLAAAAASVRFAAWRGPVGGRWRWPALGLLAMLGAVVGSLGGGDFVETRFASAADDWQGRQAHWRRAMTLPGSPEEELLGIGVGRFPARFALSGELLDQTGDYRWQPGPGGGQLVLTAGRHVMGYGALFRMTQRISPPTGPVTVRWRARLQQPLRLHLELCERYLLYPGHCRIAELALGDQSMPPGDLVWRDGEVRLVGEMPSRWAVFSIALATRGARAEFDRLSVVDADGRELLANGGFDAGLAQWLPSSDRHHLPWHAKSLPVHLLVEQGWLGLGLFLALVVFSLARVALGSARQHPLAAPLAAGLAGALTVGLFDSLLDIPRMSFAMLWLLGIAATLRADTASPTTLRAGLRTLP